MKKLIFVFFVSIILISCGNKYQIEYDFSDGEFSSEYTTTFSNPKKIITPTATKEGFIFLGWEDENGFVEVFTKKNYQLKPVFVERFDYQTISEFDIFNQEENDYFIYFYRDGCSYCSLIKDDVLANIYKLGSSEYINSKKIYVVNLTKNNVKASIFRTYEGKKGQGSQKNYYVDGLKDISNMHIASTPSLITIKNKTAKFEVNGANLVVNTLKESLVQNPRNEVEFSISYDYNDGITEKTTESFFNPVTKTLPNPQRDGYIFLGWYSNNGFVTKLKRESYDLIAIWTLIDSYTDINELDIFNQEEDEYLVYFYRDGCSYCDKIKNDVLKYIALQKTLDYNTSLKLYTVNLYTIYTTNQKASIFRSYEGKGEGTNKNSYISGLTSIENMHVYSTPTLIKIETINNVKTSNFIGSGSTLITKELESNLKHTPTNNTLYTIEHDLDGGTLDQIFPKVFYSWMDVSLPIPTKEGYSFIGWYEDDEVIKNIEARNYFLKAKYIETVDLIEINIEDIFEIELDNYYVLFIKSDEDLLEVAKAFNTLIDKVYVVDLRLSSNSSINSTYSGENGQGPNGIFFVDGVSVYSELYIPRAPSLIKITNKQSTFIASSNEVTSYFNNILYKQN